MTGGEFTAAARAAVLEATLGRCAGCGSPHPTVHHRRPRGAGGTSNPDISEPWNGLALCGDGVQGCHGWAESHRDAARLLGWLTRTPVPGTPFWTSLWGWCAWTCLEGDGVPCWCVSPFLETSDRARLGAVAAYQQRRRAAS